MLCTKSSGVNDLKLNDDVTELSSLKSTVDNWKDLFEACSSQGSEIQCLVYLNPLIVIHDNSVIGVICNNDVFIVEYST
jgi:hypothetical protein